MVQECSAKGGTKKRINRKSASSMKANETRYELQDSTRYFIEEARRAIGYAMLNYMMKDNAQYLDWMDSATELLVEAVRCREQALTEPWQK
jgi:hypothetical protein